MRPLPASSDPRIEIIGKLRADHGMEAGDQVARFHQQKPPASMAAVMTA